MADEAPLRTQRPNAPKPNAPKLNAPRWRLLIWAFVGFSFVIAAWSFAAPYNGTPDEEDHILRAYGVATGQIALEPTAALRSTGAFVDVPQGLVIPYCWQWHPETPVCGNAPGGDETIVSVGTGAGRYFPLYYGLVGAPLALWPDWPGVMLSRLISAGMCALLLAFALTDAMRWSRHRMLAAGVLLVATPMVAHMGSAVNPSGVELAAGIAFFSAAIPLLFVPEARRNRSLLMHVGISGLALVTLRAAGPLWLFLAVLALLVPLRWAGLKDLWSWRPIRWWTLGIAVAGLTHIGYTIVFKTGEIGTWFKLAEPHTTWQYMWIELQRWKEYVDEMVGVFSWIDARMPEGFYMIWESALAAAIIAGFFAAHRAGKIRMAVLLGVGVVLPTALAVRFAPDVGFITQGRYLMPLLVGLPLLAVFLLQEAGVSRERTTTIVRAAVVVLLPLHLAALAYTMVRWQSGLASPPRLGDLNPFVGQWLPPLGTVLPIATSVLGLLAIGWLVWTDGRLPQVWRSRTARVAERRPEEAEAPATPVAA